MGRVLVCVPLRPDEPRVDISTQLAIDGLRWDGPLDVLYLRTETPGATHQVDLADKLTRARHVALMCNYSALLIVEADMLPPADALQRLTERHVDIAYGTYCSRRGSYAWLVTSDASELGRLELFPAETLRKGGWLETQGIGTGCTLIRRAALEALTFKGDAWTPDWHLAQDAVRLGLTQAHNLDVRCGHRINEREVVYPDPSSPNLHRVETHPMAWRLTGQYRVADGQNIGFSTGEIARGGTAVRLADDIAVRMFRSGTIVEE